MEKNLLPNEFIIKYKADIKNLAVFLSKNGSDSDTSKKVKELERDFLKQNKSGCLEVVYIKGNKQCVHNLLEEIRYSDVEIFRIYVFNNQKFIKVHESIGTSCSSIVDLNKINEDIEGFLSKTNGGMFYFYIVHNHPFIFRASISEGDIVSFEALFKELKTMEYLYNVSHIRDKVALNICDFATVTYYDYFSTMT